MRVLSRSAHIVDGVSHELAEIYTAPDDAVTARLIAAGVLLDAEQWAHRHDGYVGEHVFEPRKAVSETPEAVTTPIPEPPVTEVAPTPKKRS